MIVRCKLPSISLLVILILSICFVGMHTANAQSIQDDSKLQAANTAVNQAYTALLDAEKAGANVTDLIVRLNDAAGVLAKAENNYRTGSPLVADSQADSVVRIAQQVATSAQDAKQTALVSSQNSFWQLIAFTAMGASIFVLALSLAWRWLKQNYINNLHKARPEVTSQ